jgi:hypothetical protein
MTWTAFQFHVVAGIPSLISSFLFFNFTAGLKRPRQARIITSDEPRIPLRIARLIPKAKLEHFGDRIVIAAMSAEGVKETRREPSLGILCEPTTVSLVL